KLDKNKNTQHSDEDADVSDNSDLVDDEVNFDEEADVAKKVLNNFLSSVKNDPVPVQRKQDDETVKTQTKISDGSTDAQHVSKPESLPKPDNIKSKPVETEEEMQRTLFISNLPFDITSEEVKQRFAGFGEIQSFFLVLHPITKRPRGTGFLKFKTLDAADAAFSAATSVAGLGIILKGRQLKVLKALNKKEAHEKEVEKMKKEEVDHRNLYLAKEGLILEGTPAAEGVSESDLSKRRSLEQKKATKLQSPNFHVSKTRLIMYNVPKSMNDKQLKKLCLEAVTSRATKQKATIRQIKLLKDSNKGKEVSKNHSRGVAFIEFTEHQHALVALRVLNNNPETFTSEHRPIVEFALDNVQTLRQRDDKIAAQQQGYGNNSERTDKKPDFNKPMDRSNDLSRKRKTPNTFQENRKDKTVETEGKPVKKQEFPLRNQPSGVQQEGKRFKNQHAPSDRITSGAARPTGIANVPLKKRQREQEPQNIDTNSTKRRKNKDPLGKDTTDKLDMLIEQYRSKFSGNRTNKSDGEKEGSRRLGRKLETQWTPEERKAANLDQRLKSLIISVLSNDQMNYVINRLTAKSTWDDLILYHEGPSDVKESRVMDLKLCYNTFKFKEGESLTQTFTRYKALMNELVHDGIKLSKLEINTGFINGLPKKWLDFCQSLRNTNHVKEFKLASLFDSPTDEEDTRSSQEYMNDLEKEYQARALLAKSKRLWEHTMMRPPKKNHQIQSSRTHMILWKRVMHPHKVHHEFYEHGKMKREINGLVIGEIDDMLRIKLREAESNEEIFTSVAWIRAFNINEPIYSELCHEFYFHLKN
ncbi:RNA-binding protein 28, partial [Tanacetum coccineum]